MSDNGYDQMTTRMQLIFPLDYSVTTRKWIPRRVTASGPPHAHWLVENCFAEENDCRFADDEYFCSLPQYRAIDKPTSGGEPRGDSAGADPLSRGASDVI